MGWLRKKKPKSDIASERASERGAMLLEDLIECCDGKSNPIKFFSADQIRKATHNFSKTNRVSELSWLEYDWYLGKNENHFKVLIKKGYSQAEEFCRDVTVSSMVSGHKNFLKLVGCCLEFECPVTVYHGGKKHYKLCDIIEQQPWKRRMKIAEDIATALAYLHTAFPRPFVYRALSLGEILLDEDGVAKLTEFSFCVSIPEGETFIEVDTIVGVANYIDYNYKKNGIVSEKTDVFAIGIIMLHLLMGRESYYKIWGEAQGAIMPAMHHSSQVRLFKFLKKLMDLRMNEIADPKMLENMGEISEQELCQMKAFEMLSLRCVGHSGEVPMMVEVAKELKKIQRSLINDTSSPPPGETQFDSAQHSSSSVVLSNKSLNTKALLACIACQVFHEMFHWVMLRWFRFFRRNRRMC